MRSEDEIKNKIDNLEARVNAGLRAYNYAINAKEEIEILEWVLQEDK